MNKESDKQWPKSELLTEEPLLGVTDVLGFESPEPVIELPEETQVLAPKNPYEAWKVNPSKENLVGVVKFLKPTIDSVLASYQIGDSKDLVAKARVMAAKAVQSYDPTSGASLPTWVSSQLRQLSRAKRQSQNVLSVPEGIQLDAYALYKAQAELEDELGREPTLDELSDKAHLSPRRIETIKRKMKPTANESSYETNEASLLFGSAPDYHRDAVEYVHNDSDYINKKIIEHTTGYGGADIWDNKRLMSEYKLTPVQLTRRKARLASKIQDIVQALEEV